ncbi:hypothetical protein PG997_006645 [Apiospora hydei]|uniref:Uncharacterized protein n=1 Tax=Apiospora hydei TaxID=1337664 RepID=A0ABR1WPC2_9PEZI
MDQGGDQPSTTDTVSAVGTWLAAGLAVIALIGIVGPLLVWRARKSERNQAINALDQGGAESFGYVGGGLWAGRQVHLLRQVSGPLLQNEPFLGRKMNFNYEATSSPSPAKPSPPSPQSLGPLPRFWPWRKKAEPGCRPQPSGESADWVQFGSLVEAYGFPMSKGDSLIIEDGRAWLPVHTSWLLLMGLIGRFGPWQDKGRQPVIIARGTASNQARVKPPNWKGTRDPDRQRVRPWEISQAPWEDTRDHRAMDDITYKSIYGLNGTLFTSSQNQRDTEHQSRVFFSRHRADRTGQLSQDKYGIDMLFWMAVGCLPANSGVVICLADVQDVPVLRTQRNQHVEIIGPSSTMPPLGLYTRPLQTRQGYAQFETWDDEDSSAESSEAATIYKEHHLKRKHARYVAQRPGDPPPATPIAAYHPRAFQLVPWDERSSELARFAAVIQADTAKLQVLSFRETALTEESLRAIREATHGYEMDRGSDWLHLGDARYINRSDGQLIAHALLSMDLSPHGYLMSLEWSYCRSIFCRPAQVLPQLLFLALSNVDALGLSDELKERLEIAMSRFYDLCRPASRTRMYFDALYQLDAALQEATQEMGGSIIVDLGAGFIEVPTVLNFIAKFPIEVGVLFADVDVIDRSGSVRLPLGCVALVFLRAALRSAMLHSALDSEPLFKAVTKLDRSVLMG